MDDIVAKKIEWLTEYLNAMAEQTSSPYEKAIIRYICEKKINAITQDASLPLTTHRPMIPGFTFVQEDINDILHEAEADISILYKVIEDVGDQIADAFNYNQNNKTRLKNKIIQLTSAVTDLKLLNTTNDPSVVYFTDTFSNYNNVDTNISTGPIANISTSEGIASLAREGSIAIPHNKMSIRGIQGNGMFGNSYVLTGQSLADVQYKSETLNPRRVEAAIDDKADTWFEYQAVNIEDVAKDVVSNFVDLTDMSLRQYGDKLRLRFIVDLGSITPINWIQLSPYMPEGSNAAITVYSISTSVDGTAYTTVAGGEDIGITINSTPQTYREDEILTTTNKFNGQGIFCFPTMQARYIEFVLDQNTSYSENLGVTIYYKYDASSSIALEETKTIIPSNSEEIPAIIRNGVVTKMFVNQSDDNSYVIEKSILPLPGWRYVIGIRDISVYRHTYQPTSEIISKPYTAPGPISHVMLYASEIIPKELMAITSGDDTVIDTSKAYDFIKYYISIDGTNWYEISPMQHEPISNSPFPPKIYEINSSANVEERSSMINKGYIEAPSDVTSIRVKIVFSNGGKTDYTPLLQDYTIKAILNNTPYIQ